jgi:phage terminase large subunit-like protein
MLRLLSHDWLTQAHPHQLPPFEAQGGGDWTLWLILGGRGAGKTRAGAEWVRAMALGLPPIANEPCGRIALVGETMADVREVMIEGVSGIRAVHEPAERPRWEATRRRLVWQNGAVAQAFSAEEPDSLRGPQFGAAWSDELAKWRYPDAAWDMLQFGLRLGSRPRQIVTTTPRPLPLLKRLAADPKTALSHAGTTVNAYHLAPAFIDTVLSRYAGTRLGRQEIDGEFIEERADALFTRNTIERLRATAAPPLVRIVVAVDPPAASHRRAAACGIVAAGITAEGAVFVLADATVEAAKPDVWAARAVALYQTLQADALVAEVNQGGEMVRSVIAACETGVPVTAVHASRGKHARAEPVAALYAQGRVRHVGAFPALEDEMVLFGPDGLPDGRSPDRLDALVWAVTHLALTPKAGTPRVRGMV